jgi:putative addiction module component (TIGR02574 family)
MSFNKDEILSLPPEEKIALAEELWSSVEEELLPDSNEEILFAEQRLKMHEENPVEGMSLESFKKYFTDKYGF